MVLLVFKVVAAVSFLGAAARGESIEVPLLVAGDGVEDGSTVVRSCGEGFAGGVVLVQDFASATGEAFEFG